MPSYLVTGCSRGLGLALVQLLASKPAPEASHIFATARKLNGALSEVVAAQPDKVHFVELDVTDSGSVQKAVNVVNGTLVAHNSTLDILVNNAGIGPRSPGGKFENVTDFDEILKVNVLAPHLVIAGFLPLLRKSQVKKIINLSSGGASISQAHLRHGRVQAHGYNVSKAAINMLTVQYALDLADEGFCVAAFAPGWTQTDMGGKGAYLTVEQSVNGMYETISKIGKNDNGKYLNNSVKHDVPEVDKQYSGQELPW
ncbi:short-chain dehydrogenase-like protein [Flagelloscypha sp. PMI_526]|nr:short-chain dehydrogenase-like protein [Flagelloscypha sp. PMI_526]